jgi:hypothetical protein
MRYGVSLQLKGNLRARIWYLDAGSGLMNFMNDLDLVTKRSTTLCRVSFSPKVQTECGRTSILLALDTTVTTTTIVHYQISSLGITSSAADYPLSKP